MIKVYMRLFASTCEPDDYDELRRLFSLLRKHSLRSLMIQFHPLLTINDFEL